MKQKITATNARKDFFNLIKTGERTVITHHKNVMILIKKNELDHIEQKIDDLENEMLLAKYELAVKNKEQFYTTEEVGEMLTTLENKGEVEWPTGKKK